MITSTVCLIAKDETRSIAEWLAYQAIVGFDRIVVYDNDSTDGTSEIVDAIAKQEPLIERHPWPNKPGLRPQVSAYADALNRCKTDWIAFFDTDEFLVIDGRKKINDFLSGFPSDAGAVAVNWLVFGSGGHIKADNRPVIERFTQAAFPLHGKNKFCKSIVRASCVEAIHVHAATLKTGKYYNAAGEPIVLDDSSKTFEVCHAGARLHHYIVKSREEFVIKQTRGHASRALEDRAKMHVDEDYWRNHDINQRKVATLLSRIADVRQKMEEWGF